MFSRKDLSHSWVRGAIAAGWLVAGCFTAAGARALDEGCANAVSLPPGTSIEVSAEGAEIDHFFSLDAPATGILTLEAAGAGGASPELDLRDCGGPGAGRDAMTLDRSASRWVIASPVPGRLYVRVVTPELGQRARLTSSFLAAETVAAETVVGTDSGRAGVRLRRTDFFGFGDKSEEEMVDPDPGKSAHRRPILTLFSVQTAGALKSEEEMVDPDPGKSAGGPVLRVRLALLGDRAAGFRPKSEEEMVDPDPGKSGRRSGRVVDGLLTVDDPNSARPPWRQGRVSLFLDDASPSVEGDGALFEWLTEVLWAESAAARWVTPGTHDLGWQLLEYDSSAER
jgi:hypothetical protein